MKISQILENTRREFLKKSGAAMAAAATGAPVNLAIPGMKNSGNNQFVLAHSIDSGYRRDPHDESTALSSSWDALKRLLKFVPGSQPMIINRFNDDLSGGALIDNVQRTIDSFKKNGWKVMDDSSNEEGTSFVLWKDNEEFYLYKPNEEERDSIRTFSNWAEFVKQYWDMWGQYGTNYISKKFRKFLDNLGIDPYDREEWVKEIVWEQSEDLSYDDFIEMYGDPKEWGLSDSQIKELKAEQEEDYYDEEYDNEEFDDDRWRSGSSMHQFIEHLSRSLL